MKKYLLLLLLSFLLFGCKKYLKKEPLGPAYDANYFNSDPSHPTLAVNAIYDAISWDEGGRAGETGAYELIFGDICSDDAEVGSISGDALVISLQQLKDWNANSSSKFPRGVWVNMYAAVARANYVLTYIDGATSISQSLKDRLKGEALFLRGYSYFYLARLFGGVPIIDHLLLNTEYGKIKRATLAQTYAFAEADWNRAKELLPISYPASDAGRATKGAVLGYLARAKLYQMGTDNTNGRTWEEVYQLTSQIIQSGTYSLVPNYATLFEEESENGSESVFEIQYTDNGSGESEGPWGVGSYAEQLQTPRSVGGWGYNAPSKSLINEFEKGDPRLPNTVLRHGDILYGTKFTIDPAQDPDSALNRKANLPKKPSNLSNSPKNHRKMRFADVLLMHAEAAYHTGRFSEAIRDVNTIRARAKVSTLPKGAIEGNPNEYPEVNVPESALQPISSNLNGQDLLNAIWHERRVELGMEALRFWDLVRTNRYLSIYPNASSHSISGSVNKIPVFPIAQTEVQFNIEQNPGY